MCLRLRYWLGRISSAVVESSAKYAVRITVYDNASTDDTRAEVMQILSFYPNLRLVESAENLGFDGNIARCLSQSTAEYVWLFSDDDIAPLNALDGIVDVLRVHTPLMAYINHYQFVDGAERKRFSDFYPSTEVVMESGIEFFKRFDLGFVSSLIIKRSVALRYLNAIEPLSGQAHLAVVSRVCIREQGRFVFLGQVAVGARTPVLPRYNGVKDGFINKANFYLSLRADDTIGERDYSFFISGLITPYFIYVVLKDRAYKVTERSLLLVRLTEFKAFGSKSPLYYFCALCAARLPSFIAKVIVISYSVIKKLKTRIPRK